MAIQPITFLDYSRISDTYMQFDKNFRLSLVVSMNYKNSQGKVGSSFNEYYYYNDYYNKNMISCKRFIDCWYLIEDVTNNSTYVSIYPKDMYIMQKALTELVLPWFFGDKRIFKLDNNGRLVLRGKYTPVEIPFNDNIFLRFEPIVLDYENGTCKEGIRMTVGSNNYYSDYNINKFLEFYYIIMNNDMYASAQCMINYIKTAPYGLNLRNVGAVVDPADDRFERNDKSDKNNIGNFFNKK